MSWVTSRHHQAIQVMKISCGSSCEGTDCSRTEDCYGLTFASFKIQVSSYEELFYVTSRVSTQHVNLCLLPVDGGWRYCFVICIVKFMWIWSAYSSPRITSKIWFPSCHVFKLSLDQARFKAIKNGNRYIIQVSIRVIEGFSPLRIRLCGYISKTYFKYILMYQESHMWWWNIFNVHRIDMYVDWLLYNCWSYIFIQKNYLHLKTVNYISA